MENPRLVDHFTEWVANENLRVSWVVLAVVVLSTLQHADARPVQVLSYKELLDRSDVVVIASPVSKTVDTGQESFLSGISSIDRDGKVTGVKCVGVETRFEVSAVIKGDAKTRTFTLNHCREVDGRMSINGPIFVFFDPTDSKFSGSFLLFLVREPDGRYAPAGGQTDPGMQAISKLPYAEPIPQRR